MTLRELVERHRIVISAGSGGVGKTTVAASIALWGALGGRRAVVITIDPARRLASSLGLETLGSEAREIPATHFAAQGLAAPRGSLAAMMLDQKGAWDALVERHAPAEARARILQNPFYQHLSQTFAGSQEYMAIEQLCLLAESGAYDLIVVDTPPTRHALDFLEAPRRIGDFLDRKVVKWFVRPYFSAGWSALRAMNRTAGFLLRRLEQATGISALAEISDFFTSMSGLFENFQPRVERAYQVLRGAETAFVLVTGPEEQVLGDAEYLSTKMAELHMPLKGVVFNRVHHEYRPAGRGPRRGELGSTTRCWRAASRCAWRCSARGSRAPCRWCRCRTSRGTCTIWRAWRRCMGICSGGRRRRRRLGTLVAHGPRCTSSWPARSPRS